MRLSFDPEKNRRNIAERGLSFELVADLDWESATAVEDTRKDYGRLGCASWRPCTAVCAWS